jgi:hypothetical protein
MERIMDDNELKRADVNRVFKEVNDNLIPPCLSVAFRPNIKPTV